MKAIIVGCGIGGLTAAIALHKAGFEVTLYERAPQLAEIGAGISLWANAFHALDLIGVGQSIRASSLGLVKSELRVNNGHKVIGAFAAEQIEKSLDTKPPLAIIHRAELVDQLARHLPSDCIRFGSDCIGVVQSNGQVELRLADGSKDYADLLVGADGIHSMVRKEIFGAEEPRYSGYTCFRGVCPRPESIQSGYLAEWWGRGMRVGITTMCEDRVYWWATVNSPQNQRWKNVSNELIRRFQGWATPIIHLFKSTPDEAVIQNDIIDRKPTIRWSKGRIVLIGDAAHPTTPNLGQGGCMAIEDAVELPYFLRSQESIEDAMLSFARARYARTSAITKESWRYGRLGQFQSSIACWHRNNAAMAMFKIVGANAFVKFARYRVRSIHDVSHR